ncbi:hypothetical protein DOTSEDRAFT_28067 [Dothistroma septosporum NZE10]|uniref:DUF7730 domain-containing protein n=1 Tax=Dothistroma septosporum (strain NZE10 / CBS 128990) TaxID=675120 RepID=N1PFU4_DOTSN|nr:hypothetical protein DOTSEDRAFT_28067 [Dothistroma septosporum NZE10]
MPWRTRVWDDRFDAATKEEFRLAAARHKDRRRALGAAKCIDTESYIQQDQSKLLSLPPEIRNVIYEYVFGHGTIHLTQRKCLATDNISLYWSGPFTRVIGMDDNGNPKHEPYVQYQKSTYSTCRYPDEWSTSYSLSRSLLAETNTPTNAILDIGVGGYGPSRRKLRAYADRHTRCTIPSFEMHEQKYLPICTTQDMGYHYEDICSRCNLPEEREGLTKTHGPPHIGLKRIHADSGLRVDLLQACRQIYHEASLLPYSLYEFDVSTPRRGLEFVKQLTTRQRRAIERVHVQSDCEASEHFKMVIRAFPNLQILHQSRHARSYEARAKQYNRGWSGFLSSHDLKHVKVITGYDGDKEGNIDRRTERAKYSQAYERFLRSRSLEEGIAVASQYKEAGGELRLEVPVTESTNDAGQPPGDLIDGLSPESSEAEMP